MPAALNECIKSMRFMRARSEIQQDGYNCGPFACRHALILASGASLKPWDTLETDIAAVVKTIKVGDEVKVITKADIP